MKNRAENRKRQRSKCNYVACVGGGCSWFQTDPSRNYPDFSAMGRYDMAIRLISQLKI